MSPTTQCIGMAILCSRRFYLHPPLDSVRLLMHFGRKTDDGHYQSTSCLLSHTSNQSWSAILFSSHLLLLLFFSRKPYPCTLVQGAYNMIGCHETRGLEESSKHGADKTRLFVISYHHARPLHLFLSICIYLLYILSYSRRHSVEVHHERCSIIE